MFSRIGWYFVRLKIGYHIPWFKSHSPHSTCHKCQEYNPCFDGYLYIYICYINHYREKIQTPSKPFFLDLKKWWINQDQPSNQAIIKPTQPLSPLLPHGQGHFGRLQSHIGTCQGTNAAGEHGPCIDDLPIISMAMFHTYVRLPSSWFIWFPCASENLLHELSGYQSLGFCLKIRGSNGSTKSVVLDGFGISPSKTGPQSVWAIVTISYWSCRYGDQSWPSVIACSISDDFMGWRRWCDLPRS